MGAHEAPDAVLTRMEADRLRRRALELVAELDGISAEEDSYQRKYADIWRWAGSASVILKELARG